MKLINLLLLSVFSVTCPSFAQIYKKGYIITTSNDTLNGYIQEGTDATLTTQLFFSENLSSSKFVTYKPQELNGFGFSNGRVFEKFVIPVLNGKDTINSHVLAKKIITGKVSTYLIESDQRETEWMLKNNETGKLAHLIPPKDKLEKKENGETGVIKDYKYLHYLAVIKQDAQHSYAKQDDIGYSRKEILNDLENFNANYTTQYPLHQYNEQKQIAYSYLAGYAIYNHYGLSNFFKLDIHRDVTWIEKSENFSITQIISYCRGDLQKKDVSTYQVLNILPVGFKLRSKPMIITPYVYTNLGLAIDLVKDEAFRNFIKEKTQFKRYDFLPIYLCAYSGAGAKVKLTNSSCFISEITYQLPLNGLTINAGFVYQFDH